MVIGLAKVVLCGPSSATTCSEPLGSTGSLMVNMVTLSTAPAGTMIVKPTKSTRPPSGPIHALAQAMVTCGFWRKRASTSMELSGAVSVAVVVDDGFDLAASAAGAAVRGDTGVPSVQPAVSETTVAATA